MTRARWQDVPAETRERWQAHTRQAELRRAEAFKLRKAERKRSGNGRAGVSIRAGVEARNQLRAISRMREAIATMQGLEIEFVGWRRSAAEEIRRLAADEFNRLIGILEASEDYRAKMILDKAREISVTG